MVNRVRRRVSREWCVAVDRAAGFVATETVNDNLPVARQGVCLIGVVPEAESVTGLGGSFRPATRFASCRFSPFAFHRIS